MRKLFDRFMDAIALMALADMEYWGVLDRIERGEGGPAFAHLGPASDPDAGPRTRAPRVGPPAPGAAEGDEAAAAIAAVEDQLAAARRDVAHLN